MIAVLLLGIMPAAAQSIEETALFLMTGDANATLGAGGLVLIDGQAPGPQPASGGGMVVLRYFLHTLAPCKFELYEDKALRGTPAQFLSYWRWDFNKAVDLEFFTNDYNKREWKVNGAPNLWCGKVESTPEICADLAEPIFVGSYEKRLSLNEMRVQHAFDYMRSAFCKGRAF